MEIFKEGGEKEGEETIDSHSGEWALSISSDSPYYYARVTQQDGDQAWSSPIWTSGGEVVTLAEKLRGAATPGEINELEVYNLKGELVKQFRGNEVGQFNAADYGNLTIFVVKQGSKRHVVKNLKVGY